MDSEIIVALITGICVIIAAIIAASERLLRRNTQEHLTNKITLERIETKLDGVDTRLTDHIVWHAEAAPNVVKIIPRDIHQQEIS